MSSRGSGGLELWSVSATPPQPGCRAMFLAETRTPREERLLKDLFKQAARVADVVCLSQGVISCYAVRTDGDTALLQMIESVLKTQFPFCVIERNLNEVTLKLVESLCADTKGEMAALQPCGVCGARDPFSTVVLAECQDGPLELDYCARCAEHHSDVDAEQFAASLIQADGRGYVVIGCPADAQARPQRLLAAVGT